jgi:rod shape-determining protein MreD
MIVTWQIALRIGVLLLAGVVLQVSFLSFVSILGATPDLVPVLVAILGLLGGAVLGAVAGFAAGLVLDSVLLQTLGVSSLVLLAVGYLAGRYREAFEVRERTPATIAAVATLLATVGFTALQLMLGVETSVDPLPLVWEAIVKALLAYLLALAVWPAVRLTLRPALVDAGPARRSVFARVRRRGPRRARRRTRAIQGGAA